jgi:anti-sigma factor RsiW
VIDPTGSCRRHRAALIDFVDRGDLSDSAEAAFSHLERCSRCVTELEATALTITALRRLGDAMARQEPRPDAWPRLRDRITRRGRVRSILMSPATGMAMSLAIVAVMVIPLSFGAGEATNLAPTPPAAVSSALELSVDRSRPISLSTKATQVVISIDPARWAGPDGLGVQVSTGDRSVPRRSGSGGPA